MDLLTFILISCIAYVVFCWQFSKGDANVLLTQLLSMFLGVCVAGSAEAIKAGMFDIGFLILAATVVCYFTMRPKAPPVPDKI